MRRLDRPNFNSETTFRDCVEIIRDNELKQRLENLLDTVITASVEFENKVGDCTLHTIQRGVLGLDVTVDELKDVYTSRFAKEGLAPRKYYDKIMSIPKHGRCPFCAVGIVTTIDHHLPKSKFPFLTVTPLNLIASCHDCNKKKFSDAPTCSEEEIIHPYFDNIENDTWLKAVVNEGTPPSLSFVTSPPDDWNDILKARLKHHFDMIELDKLYRSNSASEFSNLYFQMNKLFVSGGAEMVREQLGEYYETYFYSDKNSWQTAMFYALYNSDWYCSGGFNLE